ncbi:Mce-associated membrane protein [Amycolatopsis marina]|uniref:Mce-associated membrane protein n=1 Tax=Amycolatopsis marina TaxID=490629 RepID=A0A1I0ZTT4_9PSEU|nr:hypothetical protein [Amycolatopsis marina]SFB28961.1 Mce-associated membrane protein [Amycolatopsis marina]
MSDVVTKKPSPSPRPRTTVDEDEAEEVAEEAPVEDTSDTAVDVRTRWRRPRVLLAVLLIAVVLGGAVFVAVRYLSLRSTETARAEALGAATEFATNLSSYDFNDLEGNFSGVTENATGRFAEQYSQVGANLTELIKQHKAVSEGTVLAAGAVEAEDDHAVVLLFVDQTITNTNSPQPRVDRNRMRMTLVRQDGRWLVDDVKLL